MNNSEFKYSEEKFKILFKHSPLGMAMVEHDTGKFLEVNDYLLNLTGYTREEFLNLSFWDITPKKYLEQEEKQIEDLNKSGSFGPNEKEYIRKDGTIFPIKISGFATTNEDGKKVVWGLIEDITKTKEYEIIYKDNKELLEYIAIENNLQNILDKIVYLAEKRLPKTMCSILLLDESGKHLLNGSAPSLPKFYNEAIHGIEIGEKIGSCGSATFKKQRVIVEDINTHENWQDYLALTQEANLHSCWSEPIISSTNKALGSFAIYNAKPKKPSTFELMLIETYGNIASKAIEKHNNLKTIKENEHKLEELFNNSRSGLLYIDENRKLIRANKRFADILNYDTTEELIGFSMEEFHLSHERFIEFGKKNFTTLITSQENFNIEYELKRKDGSSIWCDLSGKALDPNLPADLSKGVLWTINDISLRKKYEFELKEKQKLAQELAKSQQTLLSLFDKGESILFKWRNDEGWSVEYVSDGIKQLLGYEKEEFFNSTMVYSDFINKDDLKRVESEVKKAVENKLEYFKHEPYRILTKNGIERWVLDYTAIERDENGEIINFIGYITDISEQIKNQEIMFHQSKIASLGEMLGNISHQWRQPLSMISTAATGTKLKKELGILEDNEFADNMDSINENAQYLSKTIDDFRKFFSADSTLNVDVQLEDSIEKVLSLIKDSYKNSNITIVKNYDCKDSLKNCNENLFIQALINIFNNAKDALLETKVDESLRYVFVDLHKYNDSYVITIRDNAGGINKDNLEKIFEPYFTTKHQSQGTGIGLYMTNQIVSKHLKGNILVENAKFKYLEKDIKGASFKIQFPIN